MDKGSDLTSQVEVKGANDVRKACRDLAKHYEFSEPTSFTLADLKAWMSGLGKHVPTPAADKLLEYWQNSLSFLDLTSLAAEKPVAEIVNPQALARTLPLPRGMDERQKAEDGQTAAVLIACGMKDGKVDTAWLAIPLAIDRASGTFTPVTRGAAPFFNREWVEPGDPERPKDAYLGTVADCEAFLAANPPPIGVTWEEYWAYAEDFVRTVSGEQHQLLMIGQAVGQRDTHWRIVQWQARGAGMGIANVYGRALKGEKTPLLRRLTQGPGIAELYDEARALRAASQLTGHMDTYNIQRQRRDGYALDRSQRTAATAMTDVGEHHVLTVNGPPGTGKTSFLRAVIATCWVDAALLGGAPPILLATAATNNAVTNVIRSFSEVAGSDCEPTWTSRWLPGLPSYGWFFPAVSRKDDLYRDFMLLRKPAPESEDRTPYMLAGRASGFATAARDRARWLRDEYLDLHRRCLGLATPAASPTAAAQSIQLILAASVDAMRNLQRRFSTWLASTSHEHIRLGLKYWQRQEEQLEADIAALAAQRAMLSRRFTMLSNVLGLIAQAEQQERRGLQWWARLWRQLVVDLWGPQAAINRARAYALLAALDEDSTPLESCSSVDLQSELDQVQRAVSVCVNDQDRVAKARNVMREARLNAERWHREAQAIRAELSQPIGDAQQEDDAWRALALNNPHALRLAFEEAIDIKFRFLHFHMAARYWEARWLGSEPTQVDERNELKALQRVAMLAPVIVATAYSLPRIHRAFGYADVLVFDEAGQAAPEIGAASFAFAKRAIVVGDTAQLKPVWNLDAGASARLATDLELDGVPPGVSSCAGSVMQVAQGVTQFSGVGAGDRGAGMNLTAHYRCRASIIEYCRRLVYGDLLTPCREERPPFLYPPMAWVSVPLKQGPQREEGSWINDDEIAEIVRWLKHEEPRLLAHYNTTSLAKVVALIAPFRAQAKKLRGELRKQFGQQQADDMVIDTVHALQGAERPIVAFSLTQSEGRYFVDRDGPNLLNVAVSRAQDTFILFAAPGVLKRTGHSVTSKAPLDVLVDYLDECGQRLYPRECVIIEAPGKRHAIEEALGLSAKVIATGGHFRQIVTARTGVAFEVTAKRTVDQLREVAAEIGDFDAVYLATDDDEDGEEIAWHVMQVLGEAGLRSVSKFRRMRFYAMTPDEIRRARELALPGIDPRRVKSSLIRKVADAQLHEELRQQEVFASRSHLALLREVGLRATRPVHFAIRIDGHHAGEPAVGYVMEGAGPGAEPLVFPDRSQAEAVVLQISAHAELLPMHRFDARHPAPAPPANTTAQVLITAHQSLGWPPKRTMDALRALYEGKGLPRVFGTMDAQGSQP